MLYKETLLFDSNKCFEYKRVRSEIWETFVLVLLNLKFQRKKPKGVMKITVRYLIPVIDNASSDLMNLLWVDNDFRVFLLRRIAKCSLLSRCRQPISNVRRYSRRRTKFWYCHKLWLSRRRWRKQRRRWWRRRRQRRR